MLAAAGGAALGAGVVAGGFYLKGLAWTSVSCDGSQCGMPNMRADKPAMPCATARLQVVSVYCSTLRLV